MPSVSSLGQGSSGGVVTKTLKVDLQPGEVKRDYSAESIVVERLDTVYKFAADGTGVREISAVTLIQSDAAARQYGVLTFPFAGNNERVEFEYVRVRKPDGSVAETPAADVQEMPQEVTRQAPFYSDLKEKQLPVRNLRAGDRLEYKVRIVVAKPEVPGQFWGQESFGKWAVILNESIELHVSKGKYVKVWSPENAPVKSEAGNETVYRWTGANLEPLIGKDGKTKQREFDPKGELPAIAWTTFKSWDEVGAWYRDLEGDRVVPDTEVKAKAAELTAGKTSEEEKAHAVYGYVATQIRYIGVAFGVGRYQPHPAGEVLRNQYGDCKDKHTLLAAMLTAAGMHPEAAMIGAGIRMNEEVPSPGAFNHMITTVPVGGKQVWLDATAEVAPYQVLVAPIRDKQTLVVPETGDPTCTGDFNLGCMGYEPVGGYGSDRQPDPTGTVLPPVDGTYTIAGNGGATPVNNPSGGGLGNDGGFSGLTGNPWGFMTGIRFGASSGRVTAPNNGTPWYKNACVQDALKTGAINAGIDAIGFIPEAGGLARMIGHGSGYRGVVADQLGHRVIKAVGKTGSVENSAIGFDRSDWTSWVSGAITVGDFIPVVNEFTTVAALSWDTAYRVYQCPK
jgi:hypothetical protein